MANPFPRALLGTILGLATALSPMLSLAATNDPTAFAQTEAHAPRQSVLSLADAIRVAEVYNPQLQLARLQLVGARNALQATPANTTALAPAASFFAQAQLGITIPETAISANATERQAQINFEQASAQFEQARQQIKLGVLHRYSEWQRSLALLAAQKQALERARTQAEHLALAVELGSAARYELLQVQAQLAGQEAAFTGAEAMAAAARHNLEPLLGTVIDPTLLPEPLDIRSADLNLEIPVEQLVARAMYNQPELRQTMLDLSARRLQTSLATGGQVALQLQVAASQYQAAYGRATAQVQEALLQAQGALAELRARETALEPATEALRLTQLRYDAGLATTVDVQGASAALLQAEAARIQAAANLTLSLAQLRLVTGDL